VRAGRGNLVPAGFVVGGTKLGLFFLLAASAIAGDVSGTWRGTITIPGQGGEGEQHSPAYMELRQKDGRLTGFGDQRGAARGAEFAGWSYWGGGCGMEPAGGGQAAREDGGMSESLKGQRYSPAEEMPGPTGRMTGVPG
jgi:hypothetical protein